MSRVTIDLPSDISQEDARLLLSLKLFETDRISLGKAAELAGYSKRTFMELLRKQDTSIIDYPPEEMDCELEG